MSQKKTNESGARGAELDELLSHLQNSNESLSNRLLNRLSDLDAPGLKLFDAAWITLRPDRKRALLICLKELAVENVEYNFGAVLKHSLSDADEVVRREAIEGLWEDEEPSLIRPLLHILETDSSAAVREAAAAALGRFTLLAEYHKLEGDFVSRLSKPLLKVVSDSAEPVPLRRQALEALAPLSLSEVTQAIWAAYREEEPEMKIGALKAMGLNCDLLWLPTVIQELGSDNPEMRCAAAGSVGALGEVEATPALIELLDDLDPEVRLAAVQALGRVGGAEAKRALRHALRLKDEPMRDAAGKALSEIEVFEEPFSSRVPEE
jgi:HEAT repeat protein